MRVKRFKYLEFALCCSCKMMQFSIITSTHHADCRVIFSSIPPELIYFTPKGCEVLFFFEEFTAWVIAWVIGIPLSGRWTYNSLIAFQLVLFTVPCTAVQSQDSVCIIHLLSMFHTWKWKSSASEGSCFQFQFILGILLSPKVYNYRCRMLCN